MQKLINYEMTAKVKHFVLKFTRYVNKNND